ncbi:hypothetical protein CHCC20375_3823 [Bacillus licheniformis]|nr:hypothetical protein CHCC20375_3823 [Bacillus licheniformis]
MRFFNSFNINTFYKNVNGFKKTLWFFHFLHLLLNRRAYRINV